MLIVIPAVMAPTTPPVTAGLEAPNSNRWIKVTATDVTMATSIKRAMVLTVIFPLWELFIVLSSTFTAPIRADRTLYNAHRWRGQHQLIPESSLPCACRLLV